MVSRDAGTHRNTLDSSLTHESYSTCASRSCCPHLCLHLACYTMSRSRRQRQHFHKCFTLMVARKEHVSNSMQSFALIQLKGAQSNGIRGLQTSWLII
ncbi:hypothetical protein AMECASPLE_002661 [Ameca splendens]|uniref:Uncharacterized protein n=1 Tax=Ameca splendens TaxID=208324 RepID=A0ABV0XBE9_9TELE